MRQHHAIFAGLLAIGIASTGPAMGQLLPYPPAGLPPQEVVALVRSTGLEPVTRPVRHGPAYVLQAVNQSGRPVRVFVDARLGRVVRVVPLGPARQVADAGVQPLPPPYARPPADIAVPDGYGPNARVAGLPNDVDDAEPYGRVAGIGTMPAAPAPRAATPNPGPAAPVHTGSTRSQSGPPPLPRPRPKLAAAEPFAPSVSTASTPAVPTSQGSPMPTASAPVRSSPPAVVANSASATAAAVPPEPVYEEHE